MKASLHLRKWPNKTNVRAKALARGLRKAGVEIVELDRSDPIPPDADFMIQTGFASTTALLSCIEQKKPYLLAEAAFYRLDNDIYKNSSWNWGGLAGLSVVDKLPEGYNENGGINPPLLPEKTLMEVRELPTVVIGQKPTDHSLRGSDHDVWIREQLIRYDDAEFRPHPLMSQHEQEDMQELLDRAGQIITYTSTTGAEALIHGCAVTYDHPGSIINGWEVWGREEWHRRLSWQHGSHEWLSSEEAADIILAQYPTAALLAKQGLQENPRPKMAPKHEYDLRG
jgi:hypothetical protein